MGDFPRLKTRRYPKVYHNHEDEHTYWKKFKNACTVKEFAQITSIEFSPVKPYDFCLASSARVQIYSTRTNSLKKTISRFQDVANCASYRNDGKLLVSGDSSGLIQIFDVNSRATLRSFSAHKAPVRATKFILSNTQIASAGDDKSLKVWDIPSESVVHSFDEYHSDYIRSMATSKTSSNIVATGSYDHTVKVWDLRSNECIFTFDHGDHPVESLVLFPGDSFIASSAGNQLYIWDLLGTSKGHLVQKTSNHQKTITCLAFDGSSSRLLTGSLDHHVKVYNVADYSVLYSIKYPSPVLSLAVSPENTHIAAGMVTGLLSIRERKPDIQDPEKIENMWQIAPSKSTLSKHELELESKKGTRSFFSRGQHKLASEDDYVVAIERRKRLRPFEMKLKSFDYATALDEAFSPKVAPSTRIALFEELQVRKDGLKNALAGRDDLSLEPIIKFIMVNLKNPRYNQTLMEVLEKIVAMYGKVMHASPLMEELINKTRTVVVSEMQFQKQLFELNGMMDMIIGFSACTR